MSTAAPTYCTYCGESIGPVVTWLGLKPYHTIRSYAPAVMREHSLNLQTAAPLTEARVREIVREEMAAFLAVAEARILAAHLD